MIPVLVVLDKLNYIRVIKFLKGFKLAEQVLLVVVVQVLPLYLLDCTGHPRLSMNGFVNLAVTSLADLLPYIVDLRDIFLLHLNDCLSSIDLDPSNLFFERLYISSTYVIRYSFPGRQ